MSRSAAARLFRSPLLLLVVPLVIAGFQITRAVVKELPPLPQVYETIPEFELVDQRGVAFGSDQLRGRVWIANFIFTRCPTVCPLFTERMAKLQDRIRNAAPAIHLVSISVDPEWDNPERLAAYAGKHRISERMWTFVTGDYETIRRVVRDSMKMSMEHEGMIGDVPDIIHGTHFVLVDQELRVRGFYDSEDEARIDQMMRDVHTLLNRRD